MRLPIKRFDASVALPAAQPGAACFDLKCRETVTVPARSIVPVAQNIAVQIPEGYVLLLFTRSSTALRKSLMLANNVGVIDPFFCGDDDEILAFLYNFSDHEVAVEAGDRLVQGMLVRTETAEWQEVERFNENGHGGYRHLDELDAK